jgi:hypothetical protein
LLLLLLLLLLCLTYKQVVQLQSLRKGGASILAAAAFAADVNLLQRQHICVHLLQLLYHLAAGGSKGC